MISSSREQRELESLHNEALVLVSKRDSQQTLRKIEFLLEKATRLNATKYLGAAYGIKGYVYFGLNETKLAIDNFEKSLGFYARKPEQFFNEIKQTKNSMGVLYKNLGESKKALEILHESIKISEEYNISSISFKSKRPFHPERFLNFVQSDLDGVYRVKGYFWLASRMDYVGQISVAGKLAEILPVGKWWAAVPKAQWDLSD